MGLEERIKLIEDKMAIKQLVDTYTLLMDEKNGLALKELFTPSGQLRNFVGGEEKLVLANPDEIANTFQNYLSTIDSSFHLSGQLVMNVNGDRALARSYFQATIVEMKNGTKITTLQSLYYDDELCKIDGNWLFARRDCHYVNVSSK